jgi:3-phosphoglycerate kinase
MEDMEFKDKRVLVRLGSDVPVDELGNILDNSRIKLSLETLNYIIEKKASKIILMCHIGRPKNNEEKFKTNKLAIKISELLQTKVQKVDGWIASDEKIVVLENLRFNPSEKSKNIEERDEFGKTLASQADIFVQDAFSNCHRDHASMTSVTKYIPSCVGKVVEKEISIINDAMEHPKRPFVSIIGGLKADKLNAIGNIIKKADNILIGGALAFTLLKEKGFNVGNSKIDSEGLGKMSEILKIINSSDKIILPTDAIVADSFSNEAQVRTVKIDSIPTSWLALDLGPETIENYCNILKKANTIIWNGPIGVFEFEKFSNGTKVIANTLAELNSDTIVGGGDSAEIIYKLGLSEKYTHVSSGGGASLELFEGKELIAIKALEENYSKYHI